MICNNCNKTINDGAVYCRHCGKKHNPSRLDISEKYFKGEIDVIDGEGKILFRDQVGKITKTPDWHYYIKRGWELIQDGEYYEALEFCNKAFELETEEPLIYNRRGLCYFNLNKREKAMQDYNRALDLDANYIPTLNNRAILNNQMEFYQLAIEDYNKVLSINPGDDLALYNRAMAKFDNGDYLGAKVDVLNALKITPEDKYCLYVLGKTLLKLGDTKEGMQNLRTSAKMGFSFSIDLLKDLTAE